MKTIDYLVHVFKIPDDLIQISENKDSHLYETYEIYKFVKNSNLLWKVWMIDEYGDIWIEVNLKNKNEEEFHTLKLDLNTYEKIKYESYFISENLD